MPDRDLSALADPIEQAHELDPAARGLAAVAGALVPDGPMRQALRGTWLGHPLHPLLTDLPIGFWTSAWALDLVGGRSSRGAAKTLVALGVVSAVPTVAAGLAELTAIEDQRTRRVTLVHAAANAAATAAYAWSWRCRARDRHAAGIAIGMVAAGLATVGGFLGGHLAFGGGAGDDDDDGS